MKSRWVTPGGFLLSEPANGSLPQKPVDKARVEFVETLDDDVRQQFDHRDVRIAEGHGNGGDAGIARGQYVIAAVADHHGCLGVAARRGDRAEDVAGFGLSHAECIATGDGNEAIDEAEAS